MNLLLWSLDPLNSPEKCPKIVRWSGIALSSSTGDARSSHQHNGEQKNGASEDTVAG